MDMYTVIEENGEGITVRYGNINTEYYTVGKVNCHLILF